MPILWDFMKHFSRGEDGKRYYSASSFAQSDTVDIDSAPTFSGGDSSNCNAAFGIFALVPVVMFLKRR